MKTVKTIRKMMKLSNAFSQKVYNDAMGNAMEEQRWFADDANIDGLRYHDHYSSFFFTISDRKSFIESMAASDMYSTLPEVQKVAAALERFECMDYSNKNYDQLDEWLDRKADELKQRYENDLHSYEDYDNALELYFEAYEANEWDFYDNCRISNGKVVLHTPAVKAFDTIMD